MRMIDEFSELKIPKKPFTPKTNSYSLTSDVLSYRRCPRQYHLLQQMKFSPSTSTQLYFGTIIHQTLDAAHYHFKEKLKETGHGEIPTNAELFSYFRSVDEGLYRQDKTPFSTGRVRKLTSEHDEKLSSLTYDDLKVEIGIEKASAFVRLRLFNNLFGDELYPKVIDTEYRLNITNNEHNITGVVDVLKYDEDAHVEIWDYKSYKKSVFDKNNEGQFINPIAKDVVMQMCLYCHMYNIRSGLNPSKAVIVCIGDLDPKLPEDEQPRDILFSEFDSVSEPSISAAMYEFEQTIAQIESSEENNSWPSGPDTDENTCAACPIRWSCPNKTYPRRFP